MPPLKNLDRLPAEARRLLAPYLAEMLAIHGDNLVSILVYGSAARGDYLPGRSDINLLFVFQDITLPTLKQSLRAVARGRRQRIAAPLFLTREYMEQSSDVFPIEFLEFAAGRLAVHGPDPFDDLRLEQENLRLECEEQLKGQLVRLRQSYLETGLRARNLDTLLKQSLNALFPVFRALYRLAGQPVPADKEAVLNGLAADFGLDSAIFLEIWRDRRDNNRIGARHAEEALGIYIGELFRLAARVARFGKPAAGGR